MKIFAVVLSGCGVFDGAEIQEATLTMLAIKRAGADYNLFAPNIPQHHVINHITGAVMKEERNVLVEAARIARGKISPLDRFLASEHDALIFPGGFGAVKNLCTWAIDGDKCAVEIDVERSIKAMFQAKKPIGAMCISPVILARLFTGTMLTTGDDKSSRDYIRKTGSEYVTTTQGQVVIDKARKFFTTPCYMLDANIADIAEEIEILVHEMMKIM